MRPGAVQGFLRSACAAGAHERVACFLVRFTPASTHPMLNYAVPDDGARAGAADVDALRRAFARRGLRARLEYDEAVAPELKDDLTRAGFVLEQRLAVLTCLPAAAPPPAVAAGFEIVLASSPGDHAAAIAAGAIAAGEHSHGEPGQPATAAEVAARRRLVLEGGAVALAREQASGEPAGSAVLSAPRAGVSELAAVGTCPPFRRRGVAGALVGRLVAHAAARGLRVVWLSAADAAAERVYLRSGFERLGASLLHLVDGAPAP